MKSIKKSVWLRTVVAAILCGTVLMSVSCSVTRKKTRVLHEKHIEATLSLPKESEVPELEFRKAKRDTIVVQDEQGKSILLMKAIRDDQTGEMVANEVLDAAIVTARFRNIAERRGKVDLRFEITVPPEMQDKAWQLRFYPDMFILGDSLRLDPVFITGKDYRKAQLKGYEQYEKFLSRIVEDETIFISSRQLEVFLRRNIPEVYAFRTDSSEVEDGVIEQVFYSRYGVTEKDAVNHYTNWFRVRRNQRLKDSREKMYNKYVKVPIVSEGIRLDTVIADVNGDLTYHYVQTINTRPKLRKVDIILSGDIWERDKRIYNIPRSEPLTFYISSLSSFADNTERYMSKVIERRAAANASYKIEFPQGKSDIRLDLGENEEQIGFVKDNLADLLQNEVFDLDSIVIVANASPEGSWANNGALSKRRGESVVKFFDDFMRDYRRQLEREAGFSVGLDGEVVKGASGIPNVRLKSRSVPENWDLLDRLVRNDPRLSEEEKENYFSLEGIDNKDAREARMKGNSYYQFVRDTLYPRLRVVDFEFHLHRKGMVKDTVHTTELDERYMEGVQLLKDMDYEAAVKILGPYQDYNAALAYMGCDRNASAMLILNKMEERTPQINYLMAILYSRTGNEREAVQCYLNACRQDPSYVHRGNLDPEISALIKLYGLNKSVGEDDDLGY